MMTAEIERSYSNAEKGLAARLRSRSQSISRTRTSSLTARFRGRSGTRRTSHPQQQQQEQQDDENNLTPPPTESSERSMSTRAADIMERHQLAMKIEMVEMMENHEKEIKFWKNKAMKMKKRMSTGVGASMTTGSVGQGSSHAASSSEGDVKDSEQQKLSEKVDILEKELANRDIVINTLRETMETQEKGNEERVRLLENQLDRLVEIKAMTAASPERARRLSNTDNNSNSKDEPAYEVSVLEQLLARVLAEKDKLLFENQNLRSVLKETKGINAIPLERDAWRSREDDSKESSKCNNKPGNTGVVCKQPKPSEEYQYYSVLYQMSCRTCQTGHSHVKYVGKCDGNVADTQQALKRILDQHFSQIWTMLQEEHGSFSSSIYPDELSQEASNISGFPASSLARHVAKHCENFTNKGDVTNWCKENIKVEIQQGMDVNASVSSSANSDKRKSKKERKQQQKGQRRSKSSF